MKKLPTPADHPNASAVAITGYIATAIIYGADQAGVTLTLPEATSAATLLITLVLFIAGKKSSK